MMESPLLEMQLRSLHLSTILTNYRRLLGEHAEPLPYLSDLISREAAKRPENGGRARIAAAHFPTLETIESFDFALQPELPKAKLLEHFEGAFVDAHRNLIFTGPPGVGKGHILSSLGFATCTRGYRVMFTTAAALLMKLTRRRDRQPWNGSTGASTVSICCSSTNLDTCRSNEKRPTCFSGSSHSDTNAAASR